MQTGRKILNLRCDRKVTQQELARACDITPSALSKIEAGINSPRANVLWRIARNLGVTLEYLLDEEMPYPYTGHSYRQDFLASNEDPHSTVRSEITREEKSYLDALRKSNEVAREIAFAVPEASVETLRLVHFILNHSKIQNPTKDFLSTFESLVTHGKIDPPPEPAATPRSGAAKAAQPKKKARRAKAPEAKTAAGARKAPRGRKTKARR